MGIFTSLKSRIASASLSGVVFLAPVLLMIEYLDPIWAVFDSLGSLGGIFASTYVIMVLIVSLGAVYRLFVDVSLRSVIVGGVSYVTLYFVILTYLIEFELINGALPQWLINSGYIAVGLYILGAVLGKRLRERVDDTPRFFVDESPEETEESATDESDSSEDDS